MERVFVNWGERNVKCFARVSPPLILRLRLESVPPLQGSFEGKCVYHFFMEGDKFRNIVW
jgi:hypothetical protein